MTVNEKAYAKINVFLDVVSRREDGFHDIISIMQSISLCDEIALTATKSNETVISIESNEESLDNGESNLIYKSAAKYLSEFNINATVNVKLIKRIPIGAGLGGGSSDAAATLRAMNRIFGLATEEHLLDMASNLGSDVPFCLLGGCALCKGRGEKLSAFSFRLPGNLVIAIGESRVSTPKAYALLDEKYGDFKQHLQDNQLSEKGCVPIYNIFESVISSNEIDEIKRILTDFGAEFTLMSGSGPSVFGGFSDSSDAVEAKKQLEEQGYLAFVCKPV